MSQYLQAHSWTRIKQMAKRRKRNGRERSRPPPPQLSLERNASASDVCRRFFSLNSGEFVSNLLRQVTGILTIWHLEGKDHIHQGDARVAMNFVFPWCWRLGLFTVLMINGRSFLWAAKMFSVCSSISVSYSWEILQREPQIRDMKWSSLVLISCHFHHFISEFPTKTQKFFLPKIGSASSHSFW